MPGAKFSLLWTFVRFTLEVLGEDVIIPGYISAVVIP